jgi:predicted Zn-dependent protease
VRQVTASLAASWQVVEILRADGHRVRDIRPMTRINVSVVVGDGDRQESGSYGMGGRIGFGEFIAEDSWQHGADEALRQALVNLEAIDAPAGTIRHRAVQRLAGRHAARGRRPRAGRRFQPQEDLGLCRPARPAGRAPRASPSSMTARSSVAARSPSMTRARLRPTTC